jgi:hypothetical protein
MSRHIIRLYMRHFDERYFHVACFVLTAAFLGACGLVPDARPIALGSPEVQRVREALARWPRAEALVPRRFAFAADLRLGSWQTTAKGVLEYWGSRDFRVTAVGEDGGVLFDGRFNWGGVMIMRLKAGVDAGPIEELLRDMVRGFEMPGQLEGLRAGAKKMVLTRTSADDHETTWIFERANGRLVETVVDMGFFDSLRIYYRGVASEGWPRGLRLVRRAQDCEVAFLFGEELPAATWP